MRVVSQTLDATRFAFSRIETKIQENVSLFRFAQIKIRFTDSLLWIQAVNLCLFVTPF